ncbi:MAG: hypothetical protein LBL47_04205, partial [Lactobacillus sp.]|nr:hypothetical protein [Lactobacillus sp.]
NWANDAYDNLDERIREIKGTDEYQEIAWYLNNLKAVSIVKFKDGKEQSYESLQKAVDQLASFADKMKEKGKAKLNKKNAQNAYEDLINIVKKGLESTVKASKNLSARQRTALLSSILTIGVADAAIALGHDIKDKKNQRTIEAIELNRQFEEDAAIFDARGMFMESDEEREQREERNNAAAYRDAKKIADANKQAEIERQERLRLAREKALAAEIAAQAQKEAEVLSAKAEKGAAETIAMAEKNAAKKSEITQPLKGKEPKLKVDNVAAKIKNVKIKSSPAERFKAAWEEVLANEGGYGTTAKLRNQARAEKAKLEKEGKEVPKHIKVKAAGRVIDQPTNYGVTQNTWDHMRKTHKHLLGDSPKDVALISTFDAQMVFKLGFYDSYKLDKLEDQRDVVSIADYLYNHGTKSRLRLTKTLVDHAHENYGTEKIDFGDKKYKGKGQAKLWEDCWVQLNKLNDSQADSTFQAMCTYRDKIIKGNKKLAPYWEGLSNRIALTQKRYNVDDKTQLANWTYVKAKEEKARLLAQKKEAEKQKKLAAAKNNKKKTNDVVIASAVNKSKQNG